MKILALGNEAVARGLYEAGCRVASSYPGTPSTEITQYAAQYDEIDCEWAVNEKVGLEAAVAASVAGVRAFSGMKHVGLNVAADPLFTASYTGVNAGLVVAVADDPGMHSSQNEQDSRHYARAAKLPMLEPSDSEECRAYTRLAYELSERFDTPVLLRLSTRISHSRTAMDEQTPETVPLRPYEKNVGKYVMMPAMARARHVEVEQRMNALGDWCEDAAVNTLTWGTGRKIGVISSGIAYQTAREALGDSVSYVKLGMVYPLPVALLRELAEGVEEVWVLEELDDFIETHCVRHGVAVRGKAELSLLGEYTTEQLRGVILGQKTNAPAQTELPARPPVLCPGCPHRGTFYVLKKLKLTVLGDIGCYTLGAGPPLGGMDFCLCMGASVSGLHGFLKARPEAAGSTVAVIGDSTFIHSGITGLVNIVYNQTNATVLILDNATTGMTGHQQNPVTGLTLKNRPAPILDLAELCRAVGVQRVREADPADLPGLEAALREELAAPEPSVIVVRRPCVLLKYVERKKPLAVDASKCSSCGMCLKQGCPAIVKGETGVSVNPSLCVGCGLCAGLCKWGAIQAGEGEA